MLRLLPLVCVCFPLLSQTQPPPQPAAPAQQEPTTRITTTTQEVIVPVTVTDLKGKFVSNLKKEDFRIFDEGKQQRITYFAHEGKQSIVVGFLVDLSSQSRVHWDKYKDMIKELVWQLLPEDDPRYSGYLITYNDKAELAVNTTHDSGKITAAIDRVKPAGGSALHDAIYRACMDRSLVKGEPYEPRRVIVIIGDGHDNASKHSLDEVLELAQRNMVTIYAVSTQAFGFNNESQSVLEKLTGDTGGHPEYPLSRLYQDVSGYLSTPRDAGNYVYEAGTGGYAAQIASGITRAVEGIVGDISMQYILRYVPDVDDPKSKLIRKIRVDVPDLPAGININYRKFYYPNPVPLGSK